MKHDVFLAVPRSGKYPDIKKITEFAIKVAEALGEMKIFGTFYEDPAAPTLPLIAYRWHQQMADKARVIVHFQAMNPSYVGNAQPDIIARCDQPTIIVVDEIRPGAIAKLDQIKSPKVLVCLFGPRHLEFMNPPEIVIFCNNDTEEKTIARIAGLVRERLNGA
ncbi:MAG TPA: hypothetical protein PKI61_03185 [bacterium]|nr:hypothetical protein [bacterium]HPT30051.1 hypothetical protein [bacterium]